MSHDNSSRPWVSILVLGTIAGLRAMSAPALLSRRLQSTSPLAERVSTALAVGELISDKIPGVPSRLAPAPLAARALSGGFVGVMLAREAHENPLAGAMLGSAAALGAAFAGYHLRQFVDHQTGLPDAFAAVGEDAVVWGLSRLA